MKKNDASLNAENERVLDCLISSNNSLLEAVTLIKSRDDCKIHVEQFSAAFYDSIL